MQAHDDTIHTLSAEESDAGLRLDKFLSLRLPEMSRSRLQALIEEGCVTCDGHVIDDVSGKVKAGQRFTLAVPEAAPSHILPQAIALSIVYEDAHMLVIDKPAGLTVHPAPGHPDMTLVNALLAHCGDSLSGVGGVARPGIVHRIDKETSGLLVVAKNDVAHLALSAQLADRTLSRTYLALVWGAPKTQAGTVTGNIGRSSANRQKMAVVKSGGKPAATHYKTLETFAPPMLKTPLATLVECKLETGRTHQIRVHLTHAGMPLIGDPVYGQATSARLHAGAYKNLPSATRGALLGFTRQALHAHKLGLVHPHTKERMEFLSPLPDDMQALITALQ